MTYRHGIRLLVLVCVTCGALSFEFGPRISGAASSSPAASPSPPAVPSNVQVVNTPSVHVLNIPTVRVQERNWQYRVIVIPKAIPGTPEWNDFLGQLTASGQQGWELVNIVETVALLKNPL